MRRMFEKPRCRCPRCIAKRRIGSLAIAGVCAVLVVGYLVMTDRPETVPDLSVEWIGGVADESASAGKPTFSGNSGFVSTAALPAGAETRKQGTMVADQQPLKGGAFPGVQNRMENATLSQNDRKPATTPKSPIASASGAAKNVENSRASNEPKLAGAWASFVAMQGNDVLAGAPPEDRREPQGYITVESKPESFPSGVVRNRSPQVLAHRPKMESAPAASQNNPPDSQGYLSKRAEAPGLADDSGGLQHFASDFVRTDQTGNVADQHRFYADSVHFYGEGDLSWTGVAAATRRYHQEKQNRRFETAAPAVVKGPVDGGFYVVDQPVSWSQTDGSRLTRGRSILRLRVVPTGRGDWKITSIEEVGK